MNYFKCLYSFIIALCGAFLAKYTHLPIPWLLGPLLVTAFLKLSPLPIDTHTSARKIGLLIIGMSLGLYFSPSMINTILGYWPILLLGLLFSLFLGSLSSYIVITWGKVDFKTAWFSSAVGGASEMTHLAEQYHAQIDKVAAAHALRVLLVVIFIPFFYKFMNWHGSDLSMLNSLPINWLKFLVLVIFCFIGVYLFTIFKLPNPWTFGPLCIAILLTANQIELSAVPPSILHLGQVLLGWALGNKFSNSFFRTAPRFLAVVMLSNLLSLVLTFCVAYLVLFFVNIPLPTLILGLSPGGVAEMTLTAKVLHFGVPLVTAFHVVRMIGVMSSVSILYKHIERYLSQNKS